MIPFRPVGGTTCTYAPTAAAGWSYTIYATAIRPTGAIPVRRGTALASRRWKLSGTRQAAKWPEVSPGVGLRVAAPVR